MHNFSCKDLLKYSSADLEHIRVDTCLVLQYNRIASLLYDPFQLSVEPYHFEEQIEYLAQNFNVISIDEMKHHLESSTPFNERTIVITFDGGYTDVLYTAKEVLEKFHIFATIFVSSSNILKKDRFWWKELEDLILANRFEGQLELELGCQLYKWPLVTQLDKFRAFDDLHSILSNKTPLGQRAIIEQIMRSVDLQAEDLDDYRTVSAQELSELAEGELITIGGHTHSYVKLSSLPKWQQIEEITKNKDVLEEVLGSSIEYFSYPFGGDNSYTAETIEILESIGFSLAFKNSYGALSINGDLSCYEIPRVKVGNWNLFTFYRFLERFFR